MEAITHGLSDNNIDFGIEVLPKADLHQLLQLIFLD
jgi:hypothetical protein